MPSTHAPTDRTELALLWLTALLMLVSLMVNLGLQPLYLEEPRRALIAMEMAENGNFLVPTQLGQFYYAKPPLFNWLIGMSARVCGGYYEWALRLPTVLSLLGMSLLLFGMGKRYVHASFGRYAALLLPASVGLLFYFSMLAEIDLFYALVTLSAFVAVFHFQQQGQYGRLFVSAYTLTAIGVLTKGFPSVVFLALSLVPWIWYQGAWRRLWSWQHLAGILVFVLLVGGYALAYHSYNDIRSYMRFMLEESGGRTVAGSTAGRFLQHLLTFPLETLKDLPPGLLLLLFVPFRKLRSFLSRNPWIAYGSLVLVLNYLPYWVSPGARQRYIYMLYPFVLMIGLYAYQYRHEVAAWRSVVFHRLSAVLIGILGLAMLALPFLPALDALSYRIPLALGGAGIMGLLTWVALRRPSYTLVLLLMAMAIGRLVFDVTVLPQRAGEGSADQDTQVAKAVATLVGDAPLYLWEGGRISFSLVFYLNRERGRTLRLHDQAEAGAYYLFRAEEVPETYVRLLDIPYRDTLYVLAHDPL
jgi:4-amino-4-deoxy-L-arabinose transferase-like glycosyltransferase